MKEYNFKKSILQRLRLVFAISLAWHIHARNATEYFTKQMLALYGS